MFEEIKTGGMAAMMKYMNDPRFLAVRQPAPAVVQAAPAVGSMPLPLAVCGCSWV